MAIGNKNCKKCYGQGVVLKGNKYVKCEACLTVSLDNMDKEDSISENELIDRLKEINAPDFVLDKDFDYKADRVLRDRSIPKEERESVELNTYINAITELNEHSKSGVRIPHSHLILSGRGYSKTIAKWSIIKNYMRNDYKVSKTLATEDVINLKVLAKRGNVESIEEYNDYFNNDLVVLDLSGSVGDAKLNITCMVEVLEKCGRMNKPLLCVSNFSRENILKRSWELDKVLKNSKLTKGKYDEFKVIEYFKERDIDESEFSFKNNR